MSKYTLRAYTEADYPTIATWWAASGEPAPNQDMMPLGTSFMLEIEGKPAYAMCAILTNTYEVCYLENFIKSPEIEADHEASQYIIDYAFDFVRQLGYKRAIAFSHNRKLKERYLDLGFKRTVDHLSAFVKDLQ